MELVLAFESCVRVYRITGVQEEFPNCNLKNCETYVGLDPDVVFHANIRKRDGLWHLDDIGVAGAYRENLPEHEAMAEFCADLESHIDDGPLFFEPWESRTEKFLKAWRPELYRIFKKCRDDGSYLSKFKDWHEQQRKQRSDRPRQKA